MAACGNSGEANSPANAGAPGSAGQSTGNGAQSSGDAGEAGTTNAGGAPTLAQALPDGPGVVATDFASSPDFVTRMKGLRLGLPSSPHQLVQIYYSANMEPVLGTDAFDPLPPGTVAVKQQSRDGDDVVDQVMIMIKQPPGTDPDHGDWIWEQRKPTTLALVSSSETSTSFRDFCSGCHSAYTATDWLAGTSLAD